MITVYCDRVGKVEVAPDKTIKCPKCGGTCTKQVPAVKVRYPIPMYDCLTCGRGWYVVPNKVKTDTEAEKWLEEQQTKHLNEGN